MINQIINLYLNIENVIGVKHYPLSQIFVVIFNEDSDNIANILAEKDNDVYDLYPDYDHEVGYIISKDLSFSASSSVGKLYAR